jgi:hypothetical protein
VRVSLILALPRAPTNHLIRPSATALFWFALPPDPAAVPEGLLVVHAHDFGRPIVTFAPTVGSPDCVWVSLDPNWNDDGLSTNVPLHVRLVQLGLDSVRRVLASTLLLSSFIINLGEGSVSSTVITINPERRISHLGCAQMLFFFDFRLHTTWQPTSTNSPRYDYTTPSRVFPRTWIQRMIR